MSLYTAHMISIRTLRSKLGIKRGYRKMLGKTFERNEPHKTKPHMNNIKVIERLIKYPAIITDPKPVYFQGRYFIQKGNGLMGNISYMALRKYYHEV